MSYNDFQKDIEIGLAYLENENEGLEKVIEYISKSLKKT